MTEKTIVVVGGGISGLTTAYYLKKKFEQLERSDTVLLLEKMPHIGGHIQTVKEQGFIFDGGPRGFLGEGKRTLSLCKELGIWDKIQISNENSKIRYIWRNNKLNPLPSKPTDIFTSDIIGWKEIKTILSEYFKRNKSSTDDESVAEFIIRRFSKDILDYFVELLITGIYAGNPKKLSAKSIFPRLKEMEKQYGSILRGLIKSKKEKPTETFDKDIMAIKKRKLVSFSDGMRTLVDALEKSLGQSVKTNANIKNILYRDQHATIQYEHDDSLKEIDADHIIFATPAFVTADLVKPLSQELFQLLNGIDYSHVYVSCLGYHKRVHDYRGYGFLSPRKENLNMLGCIWNDMVFPTLAPNGGVNFTVMYGGACHPEMKGWDSEKLSSETEKDLELTMSIKDKPDVSHFFLYDKGIPQYNIGHLKKIDEINSFLQKYPCVSVVGSYINGVGIKDCIKSSYDFVREFPL